MCRPLFFSTFPSTVNRHNADLIGLRFPTNLGAKVGSEVAIASVIAET